jgi:hypothetical protein
MQTAKQAYECIAAIHEANKPAKAKDLIAAFIRANAKGYGNWSQEALAVWKHAAK